jgi:hypothetical protein
MFEEWSTFLNLVYLHLSFEINARVNELYYEMKKEGVSTSEEFLKELKKSHIWDEVQALESFDAKQFMKDFKLPSVGDDIFSQMIGKSLMDLQLKSMGVDPSTEETAMKSLIELWDTILQTGSQAMEKLHGVKVPMDKVPEKAKENPYLFFKFFEKRFHKNAASFKKKLYKVASLLVNQEEVQSESIKKKHLLKEIASRRGKMKENVYGKSPENTYASVFDPLGDWGKDSRGDEWIEDIPSNAQPYLDKLELLKKIFEGTEFEVKYNNRISYQQTADIWKDDGQYSNFALHNYPMEWLRRAGTDYRQAENICGKDCDLTVVQKEIYNIIAQYINDNDLGSETIGAKPKKFKLIESEDFGWMGSVENSQFDELKGELFEKYSEVQIEEDFDHNILRITSAIYHEDTDILVEKGFAFKIDRVIETIPTKILYSVGEYTEIWRKDQLGERDELVDSDLSFSSSVGTVDEVMGYLHHTSLGRDGIPYED